MNRRNGFTWRLWVESVDEIRVVHGPLNAGVENISTSSGVRIEWG